jgi:hypothetical protein
MIAIIHVQVIKGDVSSDGALAELGRSIWAKSIAPNSGLGEATQRYLADLADKIAYSCYPHPGARMYLLRNNSRDIECVIDSSPGGHLLGSCEKIVRALNVKLKQQNVEATVYIEIQAPDAQTYLKGDSVALGSELWEILRPELIILLVEMLLVFVAFLWLTTYVEEATAVVIGTLLAVLLRSLIVIFSHRTIRWRVYHESKN